VSDQDRLLPEPKVRRTGLFWLAGVAIVALGAGYVGRGLAPPSRTPGAPGRALVQIVRQPTFPSLAPAIDRLCPAIATLKAGNAQAAAFAVSADGWLVSSGTLPSSGLQATFGDGRTADIDEVRADTVSGLVLAHANATGLSAADFADQAFARVGDFGFSLQTSGTGCAAVESMIGSDFLVDAQAQGTYLRMQPGAPPLAPGSPFFGAEGNVLGVATTAGNGSLLPAPIAAAIVDELIRDNPSPIASFGFRATDFTPDLAARTGDPRARGAGVALVQPNSAAAQGGLRAGDVVIAVNDEPVSSASELSRALDAVVSSATLRVVRNNQQLTVQVSRTVRSRAG
jgi:serine protease Do